MNLKKGFLRLIVSLIILGCILLGVQVAVSKELLSIAVSKELLSIKGLESFLAQLKIAANEWFYIIIISIVLLAIGILVYIVRGFTDPWGTRIREQQKTIRTIREKMERR